MASLSEAAGAGMRTFNATCHCRASALSFTVPISSLPLPVFFCHCGICRHTSGALCTAGANISEPVVDLSSLTGYKSSEHVTRWFCSTCGAHILGTINVGETSKWFVSAASVDAGEEIWDFAGHVFVGSTEDGGIALLTQEIGGKVLPMWDTWSGKSALWCPPVLGGLTEEVKKKRDGFLHARCHCGGIEFHISRPTGDETFKEIDEDNVRKHKHKWLAIHDVCNSCRLSISTWVISWFFPSRKEITLADGTAYPEDGIFGTAKAYRSSAEVNRTFCGTCGAAASYTCNDRPHIIDVPAGLLVGDDVRAEDWLEWRTRKLAWADDAIWKSVRHALEHGLKANKQRE